MSKSFAVATCDGTCELYQLVGSPSDQGIIIVTIHGIKKEQEIATARSCLFEAELSVLTSEGKSNQ